MFTIGTPQKPRHAFLKQTMQTSVTSFQSLHVPSLPFSGTSACRKLESGPKKRVAVQVRARKRDARRGHGHHHDHFKGKLVDENMIVLRKRIKEMMEEEKEPPQQHNFAKESEEWMEWEREYWRKNYKSDVIEGIGFLQTLLMDTRPSLAVGTVALLTFSVSTSLAFMLCHLLDFLVSVVTYFSPF